MYINELIAATSLQDNEGNDLEWIELYNDSESDIDLSNFSLTDDPDKPRKWVFPYGIIPAKGFLRVWATGKDVKENGELHTNYKLSKEGETLVLIGPNGVLSDSISYPEQKSEVSFGRYPDGGNAWYFFYYPTPMQPNSQDGMRVVPQEGNVIYYIYIFLIIVVAGFGIIAMQIHDLKRQKQKTETTENDLAFTQNHCDTVEPKLNQLEQEHMMQLEETRKALQQEIEKREKAQLHLLEISEREHLRIGHELHDGVVHDLTALGLAGDMLAKEIQDDNPDTAEKIQSFVSIIDQCTNKLRDLAKGLSPVNLNEVGLVGAVEQFAKQVFNLSHIPCICDVDESIIVKNTETALHLFRMIQEAVNNAVKHSHAGQIVIRLNETSGVLKIVVVDNGKGFDVQQNYHDGMGIHIMRYRAEITGGILNIDSQANKGTKITFTIPKNHLK